MSIHKCKTKANKQLQFTNIKTLQTVANSQMTNQSLPSPKPKLTNCFNSQVPRTCKLMSTHKCQTKASTQLQFTSAKTLQTVANKHVPNQTLPMPMINQSLQTTLIHKCKHLANCCQFTSANTFQTVANSPVPIPCNLLPICKCKYLANFSQFTSANTLQIVASSPVPKSCKLLPIHNSQPRACTLLQCTSAKTLQTDNSHMPNKSLQTASIHKGQYLATRRHFTSAKPSLQELARSCTLLQFTSASASFPVPKPCKLLPIHNSQPRACTLLQFTSAKTLQTDNNSQMPTKSLQAASIHQCQYLATRCHFTSVKPKPASAKNLPAALNSSLDRSP